MNNEDARRRLQEFLDGRTQEMLFTYPISHPSQPTGFCYCDNSFLSTLRLTFRGWLLETALRLPFDWPKLSLLRSMGAKIGNNVHLSASVWIDPIYPHLLTIEDNVFIGMFARITTHEFRIHEFRAGKIVIRRGAMIGCGVEIGENATVAAGCVLGKNVPSGATAIGNPARIIIQKEPKE
jgi:hypothetical protein